MTEQALDIVTKELIKIVQNKADARIREHIFYKVFAHTYISKEEPPKPSNTMLAELDNDASEFLNNYRPDYADLFDISGEAFDIINEHFASNGTTADDLIDWLDGIFVGNFLEFISEIEYSRYCGADRTRGQLTQLVFKTLLDNQDKITDDDVIYDGLVLAYMRALWQIYGLDLSTVSDDDIKHQIINVINIPKDILSK